MTASMQQLRNSRLLKGGIMLSASQVCTQLCLLLQSVVYAHLLSPSDLGIASTFLLTISILDILRNVGLEKLLVQAEDGRNPHFLATAHGFQLMRGIFSGLLLFLLGGYVARLFGTPDAAFAYRSLSVVPVLLSLINLDYACMQREMRFGPTLTIEVAGNVTGLICATFLAWYLHSYTAALWALVARSATSMIISHRVGEKRFRVCWNLIYLSRIVNFGWPLLVNGLLLLIIYQGDRFLIASASRIFGKSIFSLEDLAVFAVATAISGVATGMLANVLSSLLLPYFSKCRKAQETFSARVRLSMDGLATLSLLISFALSVAGPLLIGLIYGHAYTASKSYFGWLVATQAVRILRIVPTLSVMTDADTRNAMYSNLCRGASLLLSFVSVALGGGIVSITILAFCGECAAWIISILLLHSRQSFLLQKSQFIVPIFVVLVSATMAIDQSRLTISLASLVAAFFTIRFFIILSKFVASHQNSASADVVDNTSKAQC